MSAVGSRIRTFLSLTGKLSVFKLYFRYVTIERIPVAGREEIDIAMSASEKRKGLLVWPKMTETEVAIDIGPKDEC